MSSDNEKLLKALIDELVLRIARLEADVEILKCRVLISDFRVDGLKALEKTLERQQQQEEDQVVPTAAAACPLPPPRPPLPIGVVWPTESQQRSELQRRRDALELSVARIRRPPTPPRVRIPEFAPEQPGPRPPTTWPRRNRLRGKDYAIYVRCFLKSYCHAILGTKGATWAFTI